MKTTSISCAPLAAIWFASVFLSVAILLPCQTSSAQEPRSRLDRESLVNWLQMAKDPKPQVRAHAARAVGKLGADPGYRTEWILNELLRDKDGGVRDAAAAALGDIRVRSRAAVSGLTKLLDDDLWYVRDSAAESLGKIGPGAEAAVPKLIRQLSSQDNWHLRMSAAVALGKIGGEARTAAVSLVGLLGDPTADVRNAAETSLIQLGPEAEAGLPALMKLLKVGGNSITTSSSSLHVLGKMRDAAKEAVPAIVEIAQNENR